MYLRNVGNTTHILVILLLMIFLLFSLVLYHLVLLAFEESRKRPGLWQETGYVTQPAHVSVGGVRGPPFGQPCGV
jgi:hypothetical protein